VVGDSRSIKLSQKPDAVWKAISYNVKHRYPMVASTTSTFKTSPTGELATLAKNHAHAVLGASQDAAGQRWVHLYNPWGDSSIKTGAAFSIPIEQFLKYFGRVQYGIPKDARPRAAQ
jgi:hypothetical protein